MLDLDAEAFQLQLESHLAAAGAAAEDGGVVAQEGSGQAVAIGSREEDLDHVGGPDGGEGGRLQEQSGVVVEEVQDLDQGAIGELPGGGVALPGLVGQLSLEADERAARPLVWLWRDQVIALEMRNVAGKAARPGR